jgi:hypothetical protein
MWLCFEAILLNDAHTCIGFEPWGVVNYGYETKLRVWLLLQIGIPQSFDGNS